MRRGPLIACVCVLLVLLAGCSGAGGSADGEATRQEAATGLAGSAGSGGSTAAATGSPAPEATAADGGGGSGGSGGSGSAGERDAAGGVNAQPAGRELIYEATVRLRVDDYDDASADLVASTRDRGGYVERETREVRGEGNRTWTVGRLVLRVPAGNYSGALAAVESRGEVRSSSQSVRDVTEQAVDLRARLESLRAERDRLRELYRNASDTEEVLAVQRELSDVQTEIERAEARLRSLERRVAYATIVVELSEPRPDYEPPERSQWYETPVVEAFLASVDGVVVAGRALVVLTAYALPYLLVLSVPVAGLAGALLFARSRGYWGVRE